MIPGSSPGMTNGRMTTIPGSSPGMTNGRMTTIPGSSPGMTNKRAMQIEDIQKICKSFRGVTEDIKWQDHLCFNVGNKMFLITAPDKVPPSATFKVTDEDFELLPEREGFMPAPYMARYKWIYVDDINRLGKKEWQKYIKLSYDLVYAKLPLKVKKGIEGNK